MVVVNFLVAVLVVFCFCSFFFIFVVVFVAAAIVVVVAAIIVVVITIVVVAVLTSFPKTRWLHIICKETSGTVLDKSPDLRQLKTVVD